MAICCLVGGRRSGISLEGPGAYGSHRIDGRPCAGVVWTLPPAASRGLEPHFPAVANWNESRQPDFCSLREGAHGRW